jgi:uncharacterized protein YjiS (DUF1127 family)
MIFPPFVPVDFGFQESAMSCNATTPSKRLRPPTPAATRTPLARVADLILTWLQRSAERRQLHSLSDHMLKDMGLSRADVERETSKRYWQE